MRIKQEDKRVYRSRSQSFGMVLCIFANAVLMSTFLAKSSKPGVIDFAVLSIIVGVLVGGRTALCAVVVSQEGIRVINLFKTFRFSWSDIDSFDIGQAGLLPQVCRIHTKDGKMSRAIGIQEMNVSLLQSQDKRPARKIVEQLNQELADHTQQRSPQPQ